MYKIEIVELLENDTKYPTENRVFEQKIANLDVEKVALFLNTKSNFQALPKNLGQQVDFTKEPNVTECVYKSDDCEICPRGSHKD